MLPVRELKLTDIIEHPDFSRPHSEEKLLDLTESINQVGIIYPLIVIQTDNQYLLVSGYRRFHACKHLNLPSAPCMILPAGVDDAEIIRLHENIYREDISPMQEALTFMRLEQTYHFNREKIAKLTGRSKSYITQRIQILDYPQDIQELLSANAMSYSIARELIRVKDLSQRRNFSTSIITSGATVRTLLGWIRDYELSQAGISRPSTNS